MRLGAAVSPNEARGQITQALRDEERVNDDEARVPQRRKQRQPRITLPKLAGDDMSVGGESSAE